MAQTGAWAESAQNPLSISDLDTSADEPRIKDVRIGERLGMAQPLNIRKTIEANAEELRRYGSIHAARELIEHGKGGRREITAYHLNEAQTLLLCMLSRTARAADVRQEVIAVYMAWRRGALDQTPALADLQARVARLEAREDRALAILDRLTRTGRPPLSAMPPAIHDPDGSLAAFTRIRAQQLIREAHRAHRGDPFGVHAFLAVATVIEDGARVASDSLYRAYVGWCHAHPDVTPATHTRFGRLLPAAGVMKEKRGQVYYLHVRLLEAE